MECENEYREKKRAVLPRPPSLHSKYKLLKILLFNKLLSDYFS
jgi:hypothetical protein